MSIPESSSPERKDSSKLQAQLDQQRRTVDFDTYDILLQQLLAMLQAKDIDIAPSYQRQFRWNLARCSQLVESFFLGIPVPILFANRQRIVEPEGSFVRHRMYTENVGGNRQQPRCSVSVSRCATGTASASGRGR
jgi:hypothetical protein